MQEFVQILDAGGYGIAAVCLVATARMYADKARLERELIDLLKLQNRILDEMPRKKELGP